jgi:O-methyltransferase
MVMTALSSSQPEFAAEPTSSGGTGVYPQYPDLDPQFVAIHMAVAPFTMTSVERCHALWEATRYISRQRLPGAVVECGVWRGGSSMLAALTLLMRSESHRDLYLFDTFEGMPVPSEHDVQAETGKPAAELPEMIEKRKDSMVFAYASRAEVERNMSATSYPSDRVHYVEGRVEDTIPDAAPQQIALLRLDTDWYESTRHELEQLWDLLVPGGVLILDDYGYWAGARKAVDEFFAGRADAPLLNRIDRTGRVAVKR